MNDVNILTLFGLDISELERYEQTDGGDGFVRFAIRLSRGAEICPHCGSVGAKVKDYKPKSYRFRSQTGIEVRIAFDHRRCVCQSCGQTFLGRNPFVLKGAKVLSKNKILEIVNYLRDGLPTTLAARYAFVSHSTVFRVLDRFVKAKRRPLPRIVCIDEFCSLNSTVETKYACMVLDAEGKKVVDVLPSRRKNWLDSWFSSVSEEERSKVEYVAMDMHRPYRDAFSKWCPKAVIAIDPFHYIRYVVDAIDSARVEAMGRYSEKEAEYKVLKKYRRLLLAKEAPDSWSRAVSVGPLGKRMYASEIVAEMLSYDERLSEAYELGHSFLAKLDSLDSESFPKFLQLTIERFSSSKIKRFAEVGSTFANWRDEICNSYISVPGFGRLTNSFSEGCNNKVKTIKKACYGLTNFEHLRKRIFLVFN